MRSQLRRATERYGSMNSKKLTHALSLPIDKEDCDIKIDHVGERIDSGRLERSRSLAVVGTSNNVVVESEGKDATKKSDSLVIPDDFLCPISLELMRDPVIVATGQV